MISFNLKTAYHHIEIFEHHKQYLDFQWEMKGDIKYLLAYLPQHLSLQNL